MGFFLLATAEYSDHHHCSVLPCVRVDRFASVSASAERKRSGEQVDRLVPDLHPWGTH